MLLIFNFYKKKSKMILLIKMIKLCQIMYKSWNNKLFKNPTQIVIFTLSKSLKIKIINKIK